MVTTSSGRPPEHVCRSYPLITGVTSITVHKFIKTRETFNKTPTTEQTTPTDSRAIKSKNEPVVVTVCLYIVNKTPPSPTNWGQFDVGFYGSQRSGQEFIISCLSLHTAHFAATDAAAADGDKAASELDQFLAIFFSFGDFPQAKDKRRAN